MSSCANAYIAYGYDLGYTGDKSLHWAIVEALGGVEAYEAREDWYKGYLDAHHDEVGPGWGDQVDAAEQEWIQTTEQGQAYRDIRDQVDDYMASEWSEQSYGGEFGHHLALIIHESRVLYNARGDLTFRPPEGDWEMDATDLFDLLDITPEAGPDWLVLPYWG